MQNATAQTFLIPRNEEPARPPLERLAGGFLAGYSSAKTRDAYKADLTAWFAYLHAFQVDLLEVKRPVVDTYMRELEAQGLANNTRARRLGTVRSFYNHLVDEGHTEANPAIRVKPPAKDTPVMPSMNRHEAHRFTKAAEDDPDPYCAAALHLMLLCGLRVAEVCSRDVKDLAMVQWSMVLTVRGKGDKVRRVELPPRAVAAVKDAVGDRTTGPLILNQHGKRVNVTNIRRQVLRVAKRADIGKHLSPHCLRRSFIQISLDAGAPLRDVQQAAGHSKSDTTLGYDRREAELGRSPSYAVQIAVA